MGPLVQKKLFQHVDEHIAFYVGVWEQLYMQLSATDLYADSQKILEALSIQLQQRGMRVQVLSEQRPLIYAHLSSGATHTLLFYHRYDMHTPQLQELAAIAAQLSALEVYQKVTGQVPVNIKWLLDGSGKNDPEPGKVLEEHSDQLQADGCIWNYAEETGLEGDGTAILALGTKGQLSIELEIQTTSAAIDIMHGAIVPDALWRLIWALNSLKDAREDVKIEGFYDTLTAAPDSTIDALYSLPEKAHTLVQRWGLQQMLMDLKGFQLHYAHLLMPTCTVTSITSNTAPGAAISTLPTQAKAQIDIHLVPDQEPQDIFVKLQQHLQSNGFQDVQARILHARRPTITDINDPFVQVVTRASERAYERDAHILPITVGSYALYPLRKASNMPILLIARNRQKADGDRKSFAAMTKQIALIIEESAYGTDTTQ